MLDIVRPLTSVSFARPAVRFREILDVEIDSLYRPRTFSEAQQLRYRDRLDAEARASASRGRDVASADDEGYVDGEPDQADALVLLDAPPVDTRTFLDTRALFDEASQASRQPEAPYINPLTGQVVGAPIYSLVS